MGKYQIPQCDLSGDDNTREICAAENEMLQMN